MTIDRRRFLQTLAAGGAVASGVLTGCSSSRGSSDDVAADPSAPDGSAPGTTNNEGPEPTSPVQQVATDKVLVIIDLQGGSDGLSTVVPYGNPAYYAARPTLAVPADRVLRLDGEVGLNPRLARLSARGVTTVEGVGPINGTLSHFAMQQRWQNGDASGLFAPSAGFLARIADRIAHEQGELVGVSVGGQTPHFSGAAAANLTLANTNELQFLARSSWWSGQGSLVDGLAAFQPTVTPLSTVAESYRVLLSLANRLDSIVSAPPAPGSALAEAGELGQRLSTAADLIIANVGVRVVYAQLPGWDTHQGHLFTHDHLLGILDAGIDGFLHKLEAANAADNVLVATTSEFGRRVAENGDGFDHGVASTMLLVGQGDRGRFGDRSNLTDLDMDGNIRTAVSFDSYLASLAHEWLGVGVDDVLAPGTQGLGIFSA